MRRRAIVVGFLSCIGVFALHAAEIQVTAASDVVDGDVSSIAALMARPGSDGISIREALEAAVGTPGPHVIRFSRALDGQTIPIRQPLLIRGDGVSVQGNLTSAGQAAVTLDGTAISTPPGSRAVMFVLASSCRISRLRFTGVSGTAIEVRAGSWPYPPFAPRAVRDILIDENAFDGSIPGDLPSAVRIWDGRGSTGAVLERITVIRNVIRNYADGGVIAGPTGTEGVLRDLVIADNHIYGTQFPLEVANGIMAARSRIERTRIVGNRIDGGTVPLLIGSLSDVAPIVDNQMNDTLIARNTIIGEFGSIDVIGGLSNGSTVRAIGNSVTGVEIVNNVMVSGNPINVLGGRGGSRGNGVRTVRIVNNTLVSRLHPAVTALADRDGAEANTVSDVTILNTIAVRPQGGPHFDITGEIGSSDVFHTLTTDGTFAGVNGNVQGDPQFESGSYRPGSASPALNSGRSEGAPPVDIECRSRDGMPDIGAFERGGPAAMTLTTVVHGPGTIATIPHGSDCFGGRSYAPGTIVSFSLQIPPGASFVGWSGDEDCADGVVTMTRDVYCVAVMNRTPGKRRAVRH
ncbi:MAG: hypothetical protein WA208_05205 [Thermoanaerobaculia bacterium]